MSHVNFRTASHLDLFMLSRAISAAVSRLTAEIACLRDEPAKPGRVTYRPSRGLLDSFVEEVADPVPQADIGAEVARRIGEVEVQLVSQHPILSSLLRDPLFKAIQTALARQARRRGGPFEDPCANLRILQSTAQALALWRHYRQANVKPIAPGVDDWRDAIEAAATLMRFEKKGFPVASTFAGRLQMGIPFDWLSRLHTGLQEARRSAQKPHGDRFAAEREACKVFAQSIQSNFGGTVPPVLVERFGDLIGYQSEKIGRIYLKEWLR